MWADTYDLKSDDGKVCIGRVGAQQVRSLKAVFAQDGIDLKVTASHKGTDPGRDAREARGVEEWAPE